MIIMKRLTVTALLASTMLTATACATTPERPDDQTMLAACAEASSGTTDIGVKTYEGDPTIVELAPGVWKWQQDFSYRDDKFINREATINCYHDGSEVVDLTVTGRGMDSL